MARLRGVNPALDGITTPTALVSRVRDSLTKSADLDEDFVSGFRPDKWFGRPVADGQILANRGFECSSAAMCAAFDLFLCQGREPTFDEV